MSRKEKTIFHIIDTLNRGGAEVLLKHSIELLAEFNHVVVYLNNTSDLEEYFQNRDVEVFRLNHNGWLDFPFSVLKLRKLIIQRKPVLVHSHLFYSTLLSRFAVPSNIPLVSTLHSLYSKDAFEKNAKSLWAERISLKKRHAIIAVSRYVLQDYLSYVPFKGRSFVLYNFLPDDFFHKNLNFLNGQIKFLAVGNLKSAKNYEYLLEIFGCLLNESISLEIYGEGELREHFNSIIEKKNLKVKLCGSTDNIPGVYSGYNFYIQASSHEGFGLSVVEAMASGLPCFLSDIPVFREVANDSAIFFPLNNPTAAANIIKASVRNQEQVQTLSVEGFNLARQKYSAARYKNDLLAIYQDLILK